MTKKDMILTQFFKNRDHLIDLYGNGDMTKTEFVEENYKFIMSLNFEPFTDEKLSSEECLYNYQYYNILAKYENLQSQEFGVFDQRSIDAHKEKEFEYYALKDEATLKLLECVRYKNVEAYFLNVESNRLCGQLFEIVFRDIHRAIFHSMNLKILKKLRNHGVFSPVYKDSVIHAYVNSLY
jgi:hypothetical protein